MREGARIAETARLRLFEVAAESGLILQVAELLFVSLLLTEGPALVVTSVARVCSLLGAARRGGGCCAVRRGALATVLCPTHVGAVAVVSGGLGAVAAVAVLVDLLVLRDALLHVCVRGT